MKLTNLTMTGTPVRVDSTGVRAGCLIIQNRGTNAMYIAGGTSDTTTTNKPTILAGGSITWPLPTFLGDWYINGTSGDIAAVIYD